MRRHRAGGVDVHLCRYIDTVPTTLLIHCTCFVNLVMDRDTVKSTQELQWRVNHRLRE